MTHIFDYIFIFLIWAGFFAAGVHKSGKITEQQKITIRLADGNLCFIEYVYLIFLKHDHRFPVRSGQEEAVFRQRLY